MTDRLPIGTWVRHTVPKKHDNWRVGRIVAYEMWIDYAGTRETYEVRWIDADGVPEKEPMRLRRFEIEPVDIGASALVAAARENYPHV